MNEQLKNKDTPAEGEEITYKLSSPRGTIFGFLITSVGSTITFKDDSMDIFMFPKRMNKLPNIRYDDISAIEVKNSFSWFYAALAILLCFTIIIPLLAIWVGRFKKINITLKNGMSTTIYGFSSKLTDKFYNDLINRVNINNN